MRRPLSGKTTRGVIRSITSRNGGASGRVGKPGPGHSTLAPREVDIVPDHHRDQLCKGNPRLPTENAARLRRIAAQRIDLSRPEIAAIDFDVASPVESSRREGELDEFAHAMRLPGTDDVVNRLLLLEHQPHGLAIITGKAPIALGFEVTQIQFVLKPLCNASHCSSHLTRNEGFTATRTLVIE